jgi:hypothetical protein
MRKPPPHCCRVTLGNKSGKSLLSPPSHTHARPCHFALRRTQVSACIGEYAGRQEVLTSWPVIASELVPVVRKGVMPTSIFAVVGECCQLLHDWWGTSCGMLLDYGEAECVGAVVNAYE